MFKELRFHKNFMLLPKFTNERLTFEDPSLLTVDVNPNMIPVNDAACEILNRGLYNANTAALKKRMMECVIAPVPTKGKADSYRFVTLISDKTLIRGCKDDPDDLDSDLADAPPESSSTNSLPRKPASVNTSAEERLTVTAVRDRCNNIFSSIEHTYDLARGVCNFDFVYIKEVRQFSQLSTHEFYNITPQAVFFDYDSCDKSCARNCVLHGAAAPAGYCRHCGRPLVIVPHKIHFSVGPFGTAKPYEPNALCMKRVCPGSKFCPGSGADPSIETHPSCENAPNNSYSLRDDPNRPHVSKKNDTKVKHPQTITYKKTMGEVILGNLTPLAKSIKH